MWRSERGRIAVFQGNGRPWWPQQSADAVRLGLTVVGALFLAMEFELARPEWAAWTVLSVSLSTRASSLEKSAWRAVGTLIGAAASLAVTAAFAQDTLAFDVLPPPANPATRRFRARRRVGRALYAVARRPAILLPHPGRWCAPMFERAGRVSPKAGRTFGRLAALQTSSSQGLQRRRLTALAALLEPGVPPGFPGLSPVAARPRCGKWMSWASSCHPRWSTCWPPWSCRPCCAGCSTPSTSTDMSGTVPCSTYASFCGVCLHAAGKMMRLQQLLSRHS